MAAMERMDPHLSGEVELPAFTKWWKYKQQVPTHKSSLPKPSALCRARPPLHCCLCSAWLPHPCVRVQLSHRGAAAAAAAHAAALPIDDVFVCCPGVPPGYPEEGGGGVPDGRRGRVGGAGQRGGWPAAEEDQQEIPQGREQPRAVASFAGTLSSFPWHVPVKLECQQVDSLHARRTDRVRPAVRPRS